MKIRFLHDGNFDINNGVSHFQRGDVVEANADDAERLVEGKNAEYVNPEVPEQPRLVKGKVKHGSG